MWGQSCGVEAPFSGIQGLEAARVTGQPWQARRQTTFCTYHADDVGRFVTLGVFRAVKNVAGFASPIFVPNWFIVVVVEILHVDSPLWRGQSCSGWRYPDHSDASRRCSLGSFYQERSYKLGEEERADAVCSKLGLVILFRFRALRGDHDAGVVPQYIELGFHGEELLGGFFYKRQVIEVEMKEDQLALAFWILCFDRLYGLGGFLFWASCDVNLCVVGVENLDQFQTDAGSAASHKEYLRSYKHDRLDAGNMTAVVMMKKMQDGPRTLPVWSGTSFSVNLAEGGNIWLSEIPMVDVVEGVLVLYALRTRLLCVILSLLRWE